MISISIVSITMSISSIMASTSLASPTDWRLVSAAPASHPAVGWVGGHPGVQLFHNMIFHLCPASTDNGQWKVLFIEHKLNKGFPLVGGLGTDWTFHLIQLFFVFPMKPATSLNLDVKWKCDEKFFFWTSDTIYSINNSALTSFIIANTKIKLLPPHT